ncbi:MAG: alkaline phosphatase family protein [Acidobacteria bacterium]|nr:alkaline phosphatase family protein [Acidobacteriota bacterium]
MTILRPLTAFVLAIGGVGAMTDAQTPQAPPAPPRLVVMLVVDQMRADYISLYGHQWTKGLRRLLDTGAVFPLAAYPYAYTVTCPGHATISTGTFPNTHGMIGNEWYDRELGKSVVCTDDASQTSVPFGGRSVVEHHSVARLNALTFTDELRIHAVRQPTVVAVSLKARSAITMAGTPSSTTYAVWEAGNGTWTTSTAYTSTPWPVVDAFATKHPISEDYGHAWTRALPPASYLFSDSGVAEIAPAEFPHKLESKTGKPDSDYGVLWRRSPLADRYVGRLSQHLARELKLGQSAGTDVLAVSFSALDIVGHEYGPHSHEVQDVLVRLDETLGELLDTLDTLVGRDRYVLGMSSDHGVAQIPEQDQNVVPGSGRHSSTALRNAISAAIETHVGPGGPWTAGSTVTSRLGPNVYLAPGVLARVLSTAGAREAINTSLVAIEGVARIYWADELGSLVATDDPILRAARLSYMPGRSGDMMLIFDPQWMAQSTGTTHGTPYLFDQRVPLIFAGAGIKPGRYLASATPADLAPTLAHLVGLTMGQATGRVLVEALR